MKTSRSDALVRGLFGLLFLCLGLALSPCLSSVLSHTARADDLPASLPAPVLKTLQNECILCHDEIQSEFGRLDMSHWVNTPDGQWGFANQDTQGNQLPSRQTFREVLDRITTTDKDKHMPLGYTLKPDEFEPLREWLEDKIKP